jgi:hypothetical protein
MPGINLRSFGGVSARTQASTSAPDVGPQVSSVTAAAFGPGYTSAAPSASSALTPDDAFGLSFWLGIGAIALLIFIRQSLPR